MKGIVILGIFCSTMFAGISAYSQATSGELTLKQCVDTAIRNNLVVQQADLQMQRDQIGSKQARLNLFPDLNGTAGTGINQGRSIDPFTNSFINQQVNYASYGLSSGVILFSGLSLQNNVKQTALAYQASKMDWQQAKDNITINVILAYLQVLSNEDQLVEARNQAELSKKQTDRLVILNNEGSIAPSLLSDLKGQLASDQLLIINSENALETAKINLYELMNIPYIKTTKLERINPESFADKYDATPDNIYETALQQFAQVKAVELRRQSAEKAVKVARGQLFPTLSLNGNAGTNFSNAARNDVFLNNSFVTSNDYVLIGGTPTAVVKQTSNFSSEKISYGSQLNNNLSTSFSLNLRIPIFNALIVRNRIKLAKIDLRNNEWVVKTAKTQLQQFIEQAYVNMNTALLRHRTLLEQVNAYKESFRAADIRFTEGVGNSIDYLTAKNNLDRSAINLIMSKYDYVLRTKILDYYQGKQLW